MDNVFHTLKAALIGQALYWLLSIGIYPLLNHKKIGACGGYFRDDFFPLRVVGAVLLFLVTFIFIYRKGHSS